MRGPLQVNDSATGGKHSTITDSASGIREFSRPADNSEGRSIVSRSAVVAEPLDGSHDSTVQLQYTCHKSQLEGQVHLQENSRRVEGPPQGLYQSVSVEELPRGGFSADRLRSWQGQNPTPKTGYAHCQREEDHNPSSFSDEKAETTPSTIETATMPLQSARTPEGSSAICLPETTPSRATEFLDSRPTHWRIQQAPGPKEYAGLSDMVTDRKESTSEEILERASAIHTTATVVRGLVENLETALPPRATSIPMIGTPSTVSTAPSTDDASLGTDYKLDDPSLMPQRLHTHSTHQRAQSWGEEGALPGLTLPSAVPGSFDGNYSSWLPSSPVPSQQGWGGIRTARQRVASFRGDLLGCSDNAVNPHLGRLGSPFFNRSDCTWPQDRQDQSQHRHELAFLHQRGLTKERREIQGFASPSSYSLHQEVTRKSPFVQQHLSHGGNSPSMNPPTSARGQRQQAQNPQRQTTAVGGASSPHLSCSNPQRSSAEILKTLLRKKACLYEPDTSRSVALVTWLVGRELAMEYGFFSRQQLQSGVHACVTGKIESGTITRTKVNRCMQIILNSCFHYIIPRSDGTEERGDLFKAAFAGSVNDDSFLLRYLPVPWNDLMVKRETVIRASANDEEEKVSCYNINTLSTPKSSPRLSGIPLDRSPGKDSTEGDTFELKRAVLLCFNENVRSAEDVFRCHNEFIRDTANASQLQLSAQEWRTFFGREAAGTRFLWGNVGIPMLTGVSPEGKARQQSDVLGQMSQDEARKFRTTWCTKRYDHNHDLCGFAHVEVNNGWLRRNPGAYDYKDEMCTSISTLADKLVSPNYFVVNECKLGVHCENAHSMEEVVYHPKRYKTKICSYMYGRSMGCVLGDVCPHLHPPESTRPTKKLAEIRSHGPRHSKKVDQSGACGGTKGVSTPIGSPVIYVSPAPFSSFEKQLAMPGLQCLFRRHGSIIRAHIQTSGNCTCCYSYFGDDWGIEKEVILRPFASISSARA